MNNNKVTVLGVLFFLFCIALMGGVYFLNGQLVELQGQYDELEQQRVDLVQTTKALTDRKKIFTDAFASLENYQVHTASSDMGFYEEVQQVVRQNNLNIQSQSQPPQRGAPGDGRKSLVLTLRGDYYSFTQMLAEWRNLYTTVRVSALRVTASKTPEMRGEVEVNVSVEAIVSNK
jgi:hypothetical protein